MSAKKPKPAKPPVAPRQGPPTNLRPAGPHTDRKARELERIAREEALDPPADLPE